MVWRQSTSRWLAFAGICLKIASGSKPKYLASRMSSFGGNYHCNLSFSLRSCHHRYQIKISLLITRITFQQIEQDGLDWRSGEINHIRSVSQLGHGFCALWIQFQQSRRCKSNWERERDVWCVLPIKKVKERGYKRYVVLLYFYKIS